MYMRIKLAVWRGPDWLLGEKETSISASAALESRNTLLELHMLLRASHVVPTGFAIFVQIYC